jgi:hypothetical protein
MAQAALTRPMWLKPGVVADHLGAAHVDLLGQQAVRKVVARAIVWST